VTGSAATVSQRWMGQYLVSEIRLAEQEPAHLDVILLKDKQNNLEGEGAEEERIEFEDTQEDCGEGRSVL
jgi:hypothetical protein